MKKARVLLLVHKHLVPPRKIVADKLASACWKMEWDIISTLKRRGHEVRVIGLDEDLSPIRPMIDEFNPTIVFNLMEAFAGTSIFDQNVVSYLELLRAPYTGCNPRGLMLSRDKALAKKVLTYHGIPVPDFFVVPRGQKGTIPKRLSYPLIVKSLVLDSSQGISQVSVVANDDHLDKRVRFIHGHIGTDALVEQFVSGREFYVGVLGNSRLHVLPVWEMSFGKMPGSLWHIVTERAKWSIGYQRRYGMDTRKAALTKRIAARVQNLAKSAYRALNLTGYARIDMRMDSQEQIVVIEANANPQLMRGALFAESAQSAKLSYGRLLERIMALGLQWQPEGPG
jgi:D-alanine-D-alanine ligase